MKDLKLTSSNVNYIIKQLIALDLTTAKRITVKDWKAERSLSANAQQHLWYSEIAKELEDQTALDVKNWCKSNIGLSILYNSAKHGEKIIFLLDKLSYFKHSYESQIKLIQCLEVTSLFNTSESKQYMDCMIRYWNENNINIGYRD